MDLFLDKKLKFEKLGMESRMGEDPSEWPTQILDELYRQVPFASDYTPKVVLKDIDADRRYAMGHVELFNKLAINPRDDATPDASRGKKKVLIPVIIKDGKLSPLDLIVCEGQAEPLTDERLRKALFRPSLFEAIRKRPGDMSMIEQLYPPHRQYGGARGPIIADQGGGTTHTASAKPPLLMDAILPTIKKAHVDEVTAQLNADPSLRTALLGNDVVVPFISKLAKVEASSGVGADVLVKQAMAIVEPDVIQVKKIQGGFRIKTASREALIPDAQDIDRPTAVGALGGDLVSKVETDGTTTITAHPAKKDTLQDIDIRVASSFGLYKVRKEDDNKELVGWVFPKVMDFTGAVLPMAVFSNGSESAMQENIAVVPVARQTDVLDANPQGLGCFYYSTASGAQAFVPVEVKSEVQTPEGQSYICQTVLGEGIEITKTEGLREVSEKGEGQYCIPAECGFMPLPNPVNLASSPDAFTKTAQVQSLSTAVRVITDGQLFSFEGKPIDKLAGVMKTQFLDLDDAVFAAAVLGEDPGLAKEAFSKMRSQGQTQGWINTLPVTTMKEKYAAARKSAAVFINRLPNLRTGLLKEAAPLEDPTSVDKILSVGFLNPENISIFCSYLPEIEASIKKLSELLVAARLGLSSVDEGALQKALVHLDKVVTGLRELGTTPQA
jgi:hypothetical protein